MSDVNSFVLSFTDAAKQLGYRDEAGVQRLVAMGHLGYTENADRQRCIGPDQLRNFVARGNPGIRMPAVAGGWYDNNALQAKATLFQQLMDGTLAQHIPHRAPVPAAGEVSVTLPLEMPAGMLALCRGQGQVCPTNPRDDSAERFRNDAEIFAAVGIRVECQQLLRAAATGSRPMADWDRLFASAESFKQFSGQAVKRFIARKFVARASFPFPAGDSRAGTYFTAYAVVEHRHLPIDFGKFAARVF